MKPLRYTCLARDQFPQIFQTFMEAFSDYAIDMSYMKEETLLNRWIKNGVDFASSAGAFDGDRMVGIAMTGLDTWKGEPAGFDACTGIVRGYRGMGVAPAIFDLLIERLREQGVKKYLLEVLQQNRPAVGTYKKIGFKITREFDCLQMILEKARLERPSAAEAIAIERAGKEILPAFERFADWLPSWENSFASVARIPDDVLIYGARLGEGWAGFAAYYPGLNWILNVAVERECRRQGIATALLARLVQDVAGKVDRVKIVNVEHADAGMLAWLGGVGFEIYARQYEMELAL